MANLTLVIVYTVTNVDTSKIDLFTTYFSEKIGGRKVKSSERFGTDLVFSAIPPQSIFTTVRWAGLLRSICASPNPVRWELDHTYW
jgi:hypothetical protein